MGLTFAHLWQQHESSDMDVILLAPTAQPGGQEQQQNLLASPASTELARFPAHSVLLSNSDVLRSRLLRWQDETSAERTRTSNNYNSSSVEQAMRSRLVLELQDASEQEAALAVLQSLYAVKPLPELLSELTQEQQLQAAVLADKWQVPHVSSAAAQLLRNALKSADGLEDAAQQRILQGPPLAACLQQLLKSVLLSLFADLEAVWADEGRQQQLLGLPLRAMELLLSCDKVKVASEDTVLYTLQRYLRRLSAAQREHARQVLAPLIRCQHLSQYWLAMSLDLTHAAESAVLTDLRPLLVRLLVVRSAHLGLKLQPADLQRRLPDAPPSWALGRRLGKPVSSVSVTWDLPISLLREAAQRCVTEGRVIKMLAQVATPPLGGFSFKVGAMCRPVDGGSEVDLFASCSNLAAGLLCPRFRCQLVTACGRRDGGFTPMGSPSATFSKFLNVGVMAGGWDAVVWAAKGLPASGALPLTLTVSEVGHMQRAPTPVQRPLGQPVAVPAVAVPAVAVPAVPAVAVPAVPAVAVPALPAVAVPAVAVPAVPAVAVPAVPAVALPGVPAGLRIRVVP